MNPPPLEEKESKLMRIIIDEVPRFIKVEKIDENSWRYSEGRKIIRESRYGPNLIKRLWEKDYKNQGKEVQIKVY